MSIKKEAQMQTNTVYKKVLLFTGDSITDGLRYKKKEQQWDLNHQMGHSYAYILNGLLGSLYPEKGLRFVNRGVSGNRVIDLYARNEVDLFPVRPDILTILVGVNDGPTDHNDFKPTPVEKYERIYRLLLTEVKEKLPDCRIILMEPFVCRAGRLGGDPEEFAVWDTCVRSYAAAVKRISKDLGTYFVPLQEVFDRQCAEYAPEYWCWDGIHPTENGHGLIARQWLKTARPLLGIEENDLAAGL